MDRPHADRAETGDEKTTATGYKGTEANIPTKYGYMPVTQNDDSTYTEHVDEDKAEKVDEHSMEIEYKVTEAGFPTKAKYTCIPVKTKDNSTEDDRVNGDRSVNLDKDNDCNLNENIEDKSSTNDGDNDDEDDDDEQSSLPVDRGWAWVILAGATLEVFLYGGMMKSYGVFFVEFQKRFASSASETNVMQTIHNIMVSLTGVLITSVGLKYMSARTMIFIGGIGTFLSYLISAFLTDIRIMSLTIGIMAGISNVMLFLPFVTTIGVYFKKHRGLANSIHVSGASMGTLVFGPFYTALFDYYGYTGTMMLVAAILFNSVIGGVLIRPASFYKRNRKLKELRVLRKSSSLNIQSKNELSEIEPMIKKSGPLEQNSAFKNNLDNGSKYDTTNQSVSKDVQIHNEITRNNDRVHNLSPKSTDIVTKSPIKHRLIDRTISYDPETARASDKVPETSMKHRFIDRTISHDPETAGMARSPVLGRLRANTHSGRTRTVSESLSHSGRLGSLLESISRSKVALYASGDVYCESTGLSQVDVMEHVNGETNKDKEQGEIENVNKSCFRRVLTFLGTVFDVSVFGPVFFHYLCLATFAISGSVMMSVYLIPYAKEVGATSSDVSIIFVVISCVDLTSRILTGFIADRKWLKPTTIVAIDYIILGVFCHIVRFFTEFWSLVVFAIVQGACGGCYICLYNVILIEHMGLDKFKNCLGFTAMCHGISIAVFFQITGLLRDMTGNYHYTYHLIGTISLLGSALALTLPLTSSVVEKRRKKKCSTK